MYKRQVRSIDTSRLIEDGEIKDYSRSGRTLTVDLKLKDLLDDNGEYLLVIRDRKSTRLNSSH